MAGCSSSSSLPVPQPSSSSLFPDPIPLVSTQGCGVICVVVYFTAGDISDAFFDMREDTDIYERDDDYEGDIRHGIFALARTNYPDIFLTFASPSHIYLFGLGGTQFHIFDHTRAAIIQGPNTRHVMVNPFMIGYHMGRGYVISKSLTSFHFEAFDVAEHSWFELSCPDVPVHIDVDVCGAAFVRNQILITTSLDTSYIYDIDGDSWRELRFGTCRLDDGIHTMHDGRLYVIDSIEPRFGFHRVNLLHSVGFSSWLVDGVPLEHPQSYTTVSRVRAALTRGYPLSIKVPYTRRAYIVTMAGSGRLLLVRSGHIARHREESHMVFGHEDQLVADEEVEEEESSACFDVIFTAFSIFNDVVSDVKQVSYIFYTDEEEPQPARHIVGCFYFPVVRQATNADDEVHEDFNVHDEEDEGFNVDDEEDEGFNVDDEEDDDFDADDGRKRRRLT